MITKRLPILFAFLLSACTPAVEDAPETPARQAAVAMPDSYSARISEDILRAGGNAVDAAIAAGFALAVTYPEAGNIGGGGFMLIHIDGESAFLDYRETAPLAGHRDMYLDEDGAVIENLSLIGHRAAGVPSTVAGMWAAHQRFGSLPWKELVLPAAELAEDGFVVTDDLQDEMEKHVKTYGDTTGFVDRFGGMVEGTTFRQPELAATLNRIAESGRDDFYRGETAELLVAEMERGGGLITIEDLERYTAVWREPLTADWRGYQIVSAPPPSSGGFAVIQMLKMKDFLDHHFGDVPHNSPQYIHLVAEIEKRVFADRAEYLGDPDYIDVPIDELISEEYIADRALQVDAENISTVEASPPGLESGDTTHYSVMDFDGNAVSNTYTLNGSFGSGVTVEGAGFLLNNQMDDFSVKPGARNLYGVVGGVANEIQPGKRMLSSMSPTLLLKDGGVVMVVGTPGGSTIFTSVYQTIVNILDFGMSPHDATNATRFHHQLLPPDLVTYSPKRPLPEETISTLGDRGYRLEPHSYSFGDVEVIWHNGDQLVPGADTRKRSVGVLIEED